MSYSQQFEKLAKKLGFKIRPVSAMVNGKFIRRPDVLSVSYHNHHVLTVPKKMYGEPNERYRTLEGNVQPMFYECEYKLKNAYQSIKRTPYIKGREEKLRKVHSLEAKLYA